MLLMLTVEDFCLLLSSYTFIFLPTGESWPAVSIDARIGQVDGMKASAWIAKHRSVTSSSEIKHYQTTGDPK